LWASSSLPPSPLNADHCNSSELRQRGFRWFD
jgi:hypothetical protein